MLIVALTKLAVFAHNYVRIVKPHIYENANEYYLHSVKKEAVNSTRSTPSRCSKHF